MPLAAVGGALYFTVLNPAGGLYKTDGTTAGTVEVATVHPATSAFIGEGETEGTGYNNKLFFAETASDANELWSSDGTSQGTVFVQKLNAGRPASATENYFAHNMKVAAGKLFFLAPTDSSTHGVLWVSDGTTGGTRPLDQVAPIVAGDTFQGTGVFNDKLYFVANSNELWVTDGTAAGTSMISSGFNLPDQALTTFNNRLYFFARPLGQSQGGLWSTDGTTAGTGQVAPLNPDYRQTPAVAGSRLYFFAADPSNASYSALWQSDGTAAGTAVVHGGYGPPPWGGFPVIMGGLPNGTVVFQATSGSASGVFSSAGTFFTTNLLSGVKAGSSWAVLGNQIIFAGNTYPQADAIWTTDGTSAGTHLLTDVNVHGYDNGANFMAFSGRVYFSAMDFVNGIELRSTDGASSAFQTFDVNSTPEDLSPAGFTMINGMIYFDGKNEFGDQPWVSDGTAAGTHMLKAVDSWGGAGPHGFVGAGGKVFFQATETPQGGLEVTDGTSTGTHLLVDSAGKAVSILGGYTSYNGLIYFSGSDTSHGTELWKTDGTTAGTVLAADLRPGSASSSPYQFTTLGTKLIFVAADVSGNVQIFAGDGTAAGTAPITSVTGLSWSLAYSTVMNGQLYFLINVAGTGMELWKTDGTAAGTSMVKLLTVNTGTPQMVATGSTLFILAPDNDDPNRKSVYKSDGTTAGTARVAVLPSSVATPEALTASGNKAFFVFYADEPSYGPAQYLWVTDGTAVGTTYLPIGPIPNIRDLNDAGGTLYFKADDGIHGEELWRTDGTAGGTHMVQDLNPGPGNGVLASTPSLKVFGDTIYLAGYSAGHGYELMRIDLQDSVAGGAGDDVITLRRNSDNQHVDWSMGSTSGQIHIDDAGGLTITGNGGHDTINLDYTNGSPLPNLLTINQPQGSPSVNDVTINGIDSTHLLSGTTIDINTSKVFLKYASAGVDPMSSVFSYLQAGRGSNTWTGTASPTGGAIRASAAALNPGLFAIGYADNATDPTINASANTIELKYTIAADANLDGQVTLGDFSALSTGFGNGTRWTQADFTYDQQVTLADFSILSTTFGQSLPAGGPAVTSATTPTATPAGQGASEFPTDSWRSDSPFDFRKGSRNRKNRLPRQDLTAR